MLFIQKSVLSSCLAAARSAFPNEFMGLLTGERKPNGDLLLTGITVPPGLHVTPNSAGYMPWMTPMSVEHWGTFHSHPSFSNRPSRPDILSASKEGGVQFIACQPFTLDDIGAYDSGGKPIAFKIV